MSWIKLEHTTCDKPEVSAMAETLRCDPDLVVGKLARLWIWADQNSVDGNAVGVTESFLDRLAHKKGFSSAMRLAGWLSGENGCLIFPGFHRHNGASAKARAETNRRVAKHRKRNADVTHEALQKPLPDKSKSKNDTSYHPPYPPGGGDETKTIVYLDSSGKPDVPGLVGLYPRRENFMAACAAVEGWIKKGVDPLAIASGTLAIAAAIQRLPGGHLNTYVPSAEKFFRLRRWEDDPATWIRRKAWNGSGEPESAAPTGGGRTGTVIKIS